MQVIRLEGKNKSAQSSGGQHDASVGSETSEADKGNSSHEDETPMATGDQYVTAMMHRQIYPSLELSRHAVANNHALPTDGVDGEEGEGEETLVPGAGVVTTDGSHSSDDFVTAQQANSKLLQLLTSECSTQASSMPTEGGDSSLYVTPAVEGRGLSYESMDRPRSMPFKAHPSHLVSRKSPLATNVSRAPQIQQDHAHIAEKKAPSKTVTVRIKEEPVSLDILTEQPQPSAPPIDALGHAEIKHVNSYSGLLGKRRSLFSQTPPPGKKPATSTATNREHPVLGAPDKTPPTSGRPGVSLSSGALNLAAKMFSQATGRMGLSSSSGASEIGTLLESRPAQGSSSSGDSVTSLLKVQGSASPPSSQANKPSSNRVSFSKEQASLHSGRRMSLDSTPRRSLPSSPGRSVADSSAPSSSSRAKSWLEHLKSKLPIHQ